MRADDRALLLMYSVCCVTHMGPTVPQALTWLVAVSSVAQFMEEVSAKKRRVPMQEQTCSSPVTQLQSRVLAQVQRCPGAHTQKLTGVSRSLRWAICWFIKQRRNVPLAYPHRPEVHLLHTGSGLYPAVQAFPDAGICLAFAVPNLARGSIQAPLVVDVMCSLSLLHAVVMHCYLL